MTDKEKNKIAIYRNQGMSYTQISKKMDLSINAVKTYCKRHGLGGIRAYGVEENAILTACEHCGKPVRQNPGRKQKRFCSDKCRHTYYNHHRTMRTKFTAEKKCPVCKNTFRYYPSSGQKYCSKECSLIGRYGQKVGA